MRLSSLRSLSCLSSFATCFSSAAAAGRAGAARAAAQNTASTNLACFIIPLERCGRSGSAMAARVLAPGEAGEERLARPAQLAHPDLGGVIRARDPALQLVEAVAGGGRTLGKRRGDDHRFAAHPEVRRLR